MGTSGSHSERRVPIKCSPQRTPIVRQGEWGAGDASNEPSHIRKLLDFEIEKMEAEMSRVKPLIPSSEPNSTRKRSDDIETSSKQHQAQVVTQDNNHHLRAISIVDNMSSERETTPLSPSSFMGDPMNTGMSGANRATTTERRTTTTTTTKRVIKTSDDFVPTASEVQQLKSESRTGSISSNSPLYNASASNNSQQQSSSTSSTTTTTKQQGSNSVNRNVDGLQSPFIQDTEEGRVLKLRFDVTQYKPEEIEVKTFEHRLTVHAQHEEKSENKSVYREYNREFHLPDGTDIELIKSHLSKDGVLTVECPLPSPQLHGATRKIPIERD